MAAIQEFPREWMFAGSPTDKCRQIGNAVPPRLGQVAGRVLQRMLQASETLSPLTIKPTASGRIIHVRPHVRTRSYFKDGEVISGHTGYYDQRKPPVEDRQLTLDIPAFA
jgi:DNA (cytosine-5)-methyltransferase 1